MSPFTIRSTLSLVQLIMFLFTSQKRFGRLILYALGVLGIILILWQLPYARPTVRIGARSARSQLEDIRNETLGVLPSNEVDISPHTNFV